MSNNIIWGDYRDYRFKIYLDAERDCLSGEIEGLNGWYDSDSISHLIEQLERAIDSEINYKYSVKLAEENRKLREWAKLNNCEYPFKFGE